MLWVEREFNFDKQLSDYPDLYELLAEAPENLIDIISDCDPEMLEKKPGGKWSVKEHIGHLNDLESLHEGRLDDLLAGHEVLRPADMTNKKTEEADHNRTDVLVLIENFRKSRDAFLDKLESFDDKMLLHSALHERLNKPMRVIDVMDFMVEHDRHHMLKMRELMHMMNDKS